MRARIASPASRRRLRRTAIAFAVAAGLALNGCGTVRTGPSAAEQAEQQLVSDPRVLRVRSERADGSPLAGSARIAVAARPELRLEQLLELADHLRELERQQSDERVEVSCSLEIGELRFDLEHFAEGTPTHGAVEAAHRDPRIVAGTVHTAPDGDVELLRFEVAAGAEVLETYLNQGAARMLYDDTNAVDFGELSVRSVGGNALIEDASPANVHLLRDALAEIEKLSPVIAYFFGNGGIRVQIADEGRAGEAAAVLSATPFEGLEYRPLVEAGLAGGFGGHGEPGSGAEQLAELLGPAGNVTGAWKFDDLWVAMEHEQSVLEAARTLESQASPAVTNQRIGLMSGSLMQPGAIRVSGATPSQLLKRAEQADALLGEPLVRSVVVEGPAAHPSLVIDLGEEATPERLQAIVPAIKRAAAPGDYLLLQWAGTPALSFAAQEHLDLSDLAEVSQAGYANVVQRVWNEE